jgi:ribulose-5-phosphate 4-epimerase/fuculose-1-phosphate aldolase
MLVTSEDIRKAVLEHADEQTVYRLARTHGMITLKEDALIKAMQKLIPFEEVAQIGGALDVEEEEPEEPVLPEEEGTAESGDADSDVASSPRDLV